jgi:hypothetical protein
MSPTICISAKTLHYIEGGGHFWVYLNWALGFRALNCRVIWLEAVESDITPHDLEALLTTLKNRLEPYGLSDSVALCSWTGDPLPPELSESCISIEEATQADLLLNIAYEIPPEIVERFPKSALLDIDPGLLQIWMSKREVQIAHHDIYFTTGETVGTPEALFPSAGLKWQYTPPCVALDWWTPTPVKNGAPFTTISQWYADEWMTDANGLYSNNKRSGFLPFLDLPKHTSQPLELALCLGEDKGERAVLEDHGWGVRPAHEVSSTPETYQYYIQNSLGEFSCVKPSCLRLQNAWISDRTLCYLASGKPAVIQHTGPSRFLPDAAGLFRFNTMQEAQHYLEVVAKDYDGQCRLARSLAEEYFDARKVCERVLEKALA